MSANGIAHLTTRQQKQDAKLALATAKRISDGRRHLLDKTELPNPYVGNNIEPDSQPNAGGLIEGRPWK
jgi:hypothetical protein